MVQGRSDGRFGMLARNSGETGPTGEGTDERDSRHSPVPARRALGLRRRDGGAAAGAVRVRAYGALKQLAAAIPNAGQEYVASCVSWCMSVPREAGQLA